MVRNYFNDNEKLPGLVYVGGGILAYTAAEMMVNDRVIGALLSGMEFDY